MNKNHKIIVVLLMILAIDVIAILGLEIFNIYQNIENKVTPIVQEEIFIEPVVEPEISKILVVGDMMFDRYVRQKIKTSGIEYIFDSIKSSLQGYDIVLGNLEGAITTQKPVPLHPDAVRFTFDPSIAENLQSYGFTHISLGNNHSLDFGKTGYEESISFLEKNNIEYFGHALNTKNLSNITEINDKKVGFIAYHQLFAPETQPIIDEINALKENVDLLIVFTHWGEEYREKHNIHQENIAHSFIDEGVDIIIGSHPHVIQDVEVYKNAPIIYSLGNFIFDQADPATHTGLMVSIDYTDTEISLEFMPSKLIKIQSTLLEGDEKQKVFDFLANTSNVDDNIKKSLEKGIINISLQPTS